MLAVNYTNLRDNLKKYCDDAVENCEAIFVTRKQGNVVLISQDEYNNLIENNFIRRNKTYYDRLLESKNQLEQGEKISKTIEELGDMEREC